MCTNDQIINKTENYNTQNHQLQPLTCVKYLSFHLDNKLNFNLHIKQIKKRITSRARHFRCLTYKNKGISTLTASKTYKAICRPMLKNIKVAETSAFKIITKIRRPTNPLHNPSNELLYNKIKVQPIEERLKILSIKFITNKHNLELMSPEATPDTNTQKTYFRKF